MDLPPTHSGDSCPRPAGARRPYCHMCGVLGHLEVNCPNAVREKSEEKETISTSEFESSVRPVNVRPKSKRAASHAKLAKIHAEGKSSRNPIGENFSRVENTNVYVSDISFYEKCIKTFEESNLHEDVLSAARSKGILKPLPIQKFAISIINAGRHLQASAPTGCGKSAAYLLPIINNVLCKDIRPTTKTSQFPIALIVLPTRDLAQQIAHDARELAARTDIKICLCIGGASFVSEMNVIRQGVNILIGTVGKLVHHLTEGSFSLRKLSYLVLDEVDRLMKDDFREDFDTLIQFINDAGSKPQTLLFSATYERDVLNRLAFLTSEPITLRAGVENTVNEDIRQEIILVNEAEKAQKLVDIIRAELSGKAGAKILIFARSKERVNDLGKHLFMNKLKAYTLHSDEDQFERTRILSDFDRGCRPLLVATLLAHRGLDMNQVNYVINYDLPSTIEAYINCLGRTGRLGNSGRATSFFDPQGKNDVRIAGGLRNMLTDAGVSQIPDFL